MSDLLETVLEAHGGLERWNQLDTVSARLIRGGVLWAVKGHAGVLDDVVVTARLHEERVSHRPFGAADRQSAFTPERVAIQAAHYVSDYHEVAGIKLPTKHKIFPRTPDGQSLPEPLFVSIDLSEIAFA
ncbi:MAG: hypothetical protein JWL83_1046 [Actinomycetia bacterium]|nr:hypothetical protein [Actinomycetes bacterium]